MRSEAPQKGAGRAGAATREKGASQPTTKHQHKVPLEGAPLRAAAAAAALTWL